MWKIAIVVQDGAYPFALAAMCEVWGEPRNPDDGTPVIDVVTVTEKPGRVRGATGLDIHVESGLDVARDADLICVSAKREHSAPSGEVVDLLREAGEGGQEVLAHGTASFTVGQAGLLDGRRCTTHWRYVGELAALYPEARVDCNALYVQDGSLTTSAGAGAGLDAVLHLMRDHCGAEVAAAAARQMLWPPRRDGGQAQFISRAVPEHDAATLGPLLNWVVENLDEDHSVEALAARAHMSPRTFARRFREETGTTPYGWVTRQRVAAAEELLERTDRTMEWVATEVGLGTAAALRHHFTRIRGVSPQQYRRAFSA